MSVILIFGGLVFVGDIVSIGIASLVEQFSKFWGLLVFLGLFVGVFCVAWPLAVRLTERFLIRTS
jgi:hypothetical protein